MAQLRILWMATFLSTILYGIAAWVMLHEHPSAIPLATALRAPIVLALYAVCIVLYVAAFLVSASRARAGAPPMTVFLIRVALLEGVCIAGLVTSLTQGDWRLFIPSFALSFVGFARSFPVQS